MSTPTKAVRWGIIGCGDVTEKKSGPAYQKTSGFSIGAVMRRDATKAKDYAKRHGIPKFYGDADQLINDPEIDAVYIATPPDSHKLYALKTAAAGKPCCIEKPMAPTYRECAEIEAAFEKAGVPLFVAYYRRCLPRFVQVKKWLEANRIGTVRHVNWTLTKPASALDLSKAYNWRTDSKIAVGGYFDDLASHGIDLINYLLGDIKQASGFAINHGLYSAYDSVTACWLHENGITGSGNWNFGSQDHTDLVEIFGSAGKIEFSVFMDTPIRLQTPDKEEALEIDHPENVQLHFVEAMRDDLAGKALHPSSGATAANTTRILSQILGTV